jgi:hypothetical protein
VWQGFVAAGRCVAVENVWQVWQGNPNIGIDGMTFSRERAAGGLAEIRNMEVKIVNGLHAHFKQPSGESRAGHDWIVAINDESGERKLVARTYDDDAPQFTPEQHARRALSHVVQLINTGTIPPRPTTGTPDFIFIPKT